MLTSAHDIVFAFPPAKGNSGSFASHLGVAYLRAVLARRGITSCQYINPNPGTIAETARDLLALRPGIVGFTAYDRNFGLCLSIARSIKRQQPCAKIVFGGPSVAFSAKEMLARHKEIDLCILGEAEETGPPILGNLLTGVFPNLEQPGVAFRRDGEIICTGDVPLVSGTAVSMHAALDATPSPYLSGMLPDGRTGLLTGRGCTHRCQYCCFAALGRRKLRLHSVERVLAELEFIAAHQRRTGHQYRVRVHDDTFTLLPGRARILCEAIIGRRWNLTLSCVTRADAVDGELLQLMRAAGFDSIAFGLESAVPSVLRATGKVRPPDWPDHDLTPERQFINQFRQAVISAKKIGLRVGVSIILGLPTETASDGEATLRYLATLPIDYYAHNVLKLYPGTPLWDTHGRYGIACSIDEMGLPETKAHAYDVYSLRPRPKCILKNQANMIRTLVADAIHDCEAPRAGGNSISTAIVEADDLKAETAEWLHDVLAVGGLVLQFYHASCQRSREHKFERDRRTISEHLVPARYYVQVERKDARNGTSRYLIACSVVDSYLAYKPRLLSITTSEEPSPMLAWLRGIPTSCESCETSPDLLLSAEFARLTRRIEAASGGSPLWRMPTAPRLRYPGRWLKGAASCSTLDRIEVDDQGQVRCCRFGDPLGQVGQSKQCLLRRFAELAREAEKRRGCDRCTITDCPRCPFPGLDDQTYCGTIRKCAPARGTLKCIHVYSQLPSMLSRPLDDS